MFFCQNRSTSIVVGPIVTSANVFTTAATTALNLAVSKNGSSDVIYNTTAITIQSTITCRFRIALSSNAVDTLGNIRILPYQTVSIKSYFAIDGDVISSAMHDRLFGATGLAVPSDVWGYSTRNLSSFGVTLGYDIWAVTTRSLTTYGGPSTFALTAVTSGVWAYTDRTLTSFNGLSTVATTFTLDQITSGVWAYTSRDLSTYAGLSSAVWAETTRTLTSYGGASTASVAQISTGIWAEASRTLTSWGGASTASAVQISSAVWAETTRSVTTGTVGTVNNIASTGIDGIWDEAMEGTLTARQSMSVQTAVLAGHTTGGGSTAYTFMKWNSTDDRVSYTLTSVGDRSMTTYDLT